MNMFWILLTVFITTCHYCIIIKEENLLREDGETVKAIIERAYASRGGNMLVYKYNYKGITNTNAVLSPGPYRNCRKTKACYGDTIWIEVSASNPKISRYKGRYTSK